MSHYTYSSPTSVHSHHIFDNHHSTHNRKNMYRDRSGASSSGNSTASSRSGMPLELPSGYREMNELEKIRVLLHIDGEPEPSSSSSRKYSPSNKRSSSGSSSPSSDTLCDLCGKTYSRRSNLYKHIRSVHGNERKFVCNTCGFPFKRQDHLDKHIRSVHFGEKNFKCDVCGEHFSEKFNRDKHRRTIHETKRNYRCPCGFYFKGWDKMSHCQHCKKNQASRN